MIRIHREGRLIVAVTLAIVLALEISAALISSYPFRYLINAASLAILVLVLRFFRVPRRRFFRDDRTVVSAADGKVVAVEMVEEPEWIAGKCTQVSVFMSIHDVHINYIPIEGKIGYSRYHPGKYLVARHPKSSLENERFSTGIETPFGKVLVRQVAGAVARRIRSYANPDSRVRQGEELGFIRFGSRVDIFLPPGSKLLVSPGQRVTGGVTPLARFK